MNAQACLDACRHHRAYLEGSDSGPTGDVASSAVGVSFCTSISKLLDSCLSSPVNLPARCAAVDDLPAKFQMKPGRYTTGLYATLNTHRVKPASSGTGRTAKK
jgi:hypothetical protein